MKSVNDLDVVEGLILARVALSGEPGETSGAVRKDIGPLVARNLSKPEQERILTNAITSMLERDLIEPCGRNRHRVTPGGRKLSLKFLALEDLPPKTSWAKLRDRVLVAKAMGLNAKSLRVLNHISKADGLRAMTLLDLFGGPQKSLTSSGLLPTLGQATDMLVAAQLGASRSGVAELRNALLARWVESEREQSDDEGDGTFVKDVVQAARQSPAERFGDDKVLIAHAWEQYRKEHPTKALSIESFKEKVLEAQRKGQIELSRADLVEAMNPEKVIESEISYLGTRFHFIRI
ncbi:MAG: hypothetical protein ACAI34_16205 [Verrucomicrobium sp.]